MNTLSHHILIYDRDCPLCAAYTRLFIRSGFLDQQGRKAYQDMHFNQTGIDPELARNKIALLNTDTREVCYGIDSLTKIIAFQYPFIGCMMKIKPLYWLMSQLYNLISFNRKIIIPVSCNKLSACNPTKNSFWRITFVLLCLTPTSLLLTDFIKHFTNGHEPAYLSALLVMAAIPFQWFICVLIRERNRYDYMGQLAFVTCMGAHLLALMMACLSAVGGVTKTGATIAGLVVLVWLLKKHKRRMKIADMKPVLTVSLLIYCIVSIALWCCMISVS
ncbi:MAG: DUF393 domain-containing protein [Chitinophagaceae bacterium]|nr:DUF393 domain-containing protein [Chitinophagaceae bacterium]